MKKLLIIGFMLLGLVTLYGCGEKIDNAIRKPINNLTDQEKNSAWLDSVSEAVSPKQEEQKQVSQDDIFEKNAKCYEVSQQYIDGIKDKYSSYDWTNKGQPSVFYSVDMDACLGTYGVTNGSQGTLMIENIFDDTKHSVYMYGNINLCERTFDKIEYEDNCNKLENPNDPQSARKDAGMKWEQEIRTLKGN